MKKYVVDGTPIYSQGFIPPKGFLAIAIYDVIFWRKDLQKYLDNPRYESYVHKTVNHENIHKAQMQDFCKWIPIGGTIFYIHYLLEWIVRLFINGVKNNAAYSNLSFEREAYMNADNLDYLKTRKRFSWNKYMKKSEN